jgi:hypothetical protein
MPKRVRVEVTQADIARAVRSDSYNCVVAQAVARAIPDATRIEVDTQSIRYTQGENRVVHLTPYAVQGYVVAFDAGEELQPFSFTLHSPIVHRKRTRTPEGKAANAAASAARYQAKKKAEQAKPLDEAAARAAGRRAAKAAYADARKAAADAKVDVAAGTSTRKAPPRVFKKKSRSYGQRLLRINQEP